MIRYKGEQQEAKHIIKKAVQEIAGYRRAPYVEAEGKQERINDDKVFNEQRFECARYQLARPLYRQAVVDPGSRVVFIVGNQQYAVGNGKHGQVNKPEVTVCFA